MRKDAVPKKDDDATENDFVVTIIMKQPQEDVKKISAMPSPREMLSRRLSRKMSSKVMGQSEEETPRRLIDLSSDLLINPPCNGQFSADLQLNKLMEECKQELFLHICGMKIDVFSDKEKEREEIVENPRKISGKKSELNPTEDMKLLGQVVLPMFIDPDSYEFCLDSSMKLQVKADIKGTIRQRPSHLEVPVPEHFRVVKGLSDLRKKIVRRLKSDSAACIPDSAQPQRKISSTGMIRKKISVSSIGSEKLSPVMLQGSTTVKGIFRPFQLLQKEGSKKKVRPNACRWEINRSNYCSKQEVGLYGKPKPRGSI